MARPFVRRPLHRRSFFDRLLGRERKDNAVVEINNLLADAADVTHVSLEQVAAIEERFGTVSSSAMAEQRGALLQQYLEHCLTDRVLEDTEVDRLRHLKRLLQLSDRRVSELENAATQHIYAEALEPALADRRLDDEERAFLEKLAHDLRLSPVYAQEILAGRAEELLQAYLDGAIADERLSAEEDEELQAIARHLGVQLPLSAATRSELDRYRLLWRIEEGDLPEVEADIRLQRSESCHFIADVAWHEHRKRTRRIRYSGPTLRIKIMKGVYWRAGDMAVQRVSEDVLAHIDSGRVYLTSKRLLFRGERGNKTIRLNRIINVTPYQNGIEIEKDKGKSPFLQFDRGVDVCALVLARLLEAVE